MVWLGIVIYVVMVGGVLLGVVVSKVWGFVGIVGVSVFLLIVVLLVVSFLCGVVFGVSCCMFFY